MFSFLISCHSTDLGKTMRSNYLKRYQSGEYHVWDELVNSAPEVLSSQILREQAIKIANEIMARVRRNVTCLRSTLVSAGASVGPAGSPLTPNDLQFLTNRFGPLPLSLEAFYLSIGSISLTPKAEYDYGNVTLERANGVSLIALDPLQVYSATDLRGFLDDYEDNDEDEPFNLFLSPDFLHKQNISGGLPYSIELPPVTPADNLDPVVQGERHALSFVNYLRYCFEWGGFPGLDVLEQNDAEIDLNLRIGYKKVRGPWRQAYQQLLISLRKDLLDF